MGKKLILIRFLIVVATLSSAATPETNTIGDVIGWTTPPRGASTYSTWATKKKFQISDEIDFNWTGTHDVAQVSKADYDKCRKTNPFGEIQRTLYFSCAVDSHCDRGQKVTIKAGKAQSCASSPAVEALPATFFTLL